MKIQSICRVKRHFRYDGLHRIIVVYLFKSVFLSMFELEMHEIVEKHKCLTCIDGGGKYDVHATHKAHL